MPSELASEIRAQACLGVLSSVVSQRSIPDLCEDLRVKLGKFVTFNRLVLLLLDEDGENVRIGGFVSDSAHQLQVGHTFSLTESPAGEVIRTQKHLHLPDVGRETRYPALIDVLRREGVGCVCYVPLTSPARQLGALAITSVEREFSAEALELIRIATQPVAVALENILNRERLQQERDRLEIQLKVNNELVTRRELPELFRHVSEALRDTVPHEFLALSTWDAAEEKLRFRVQANRGQTVFSIQEHEVPLQGTASGEAFTSGRPRVYDAELTGRVAGQYGENLRAQGIRSMCAIPLRTARGPVGAISLGSRRDGTYTPAAVELLLAVGRQLSIAVENALSFARVEEANRKLRETNVYLTEELQTAGPSEDILGRSACIRQLLQQIETVAGTGATVLVCGETGSGKELVARAIHQKSQRHRGAFVKLNCAAIPTGLLESELFGHERGAFTGAIAQKVGRFEIADQGTLFLDEIGEISLDLQPKLLRVLQDREFERLGSVRTLRSDARLIAATNRDLKKMAEANQFRPDLFYRLNVFPITVPPLRDRREDIPLLAMHFTRHFAMRFGRKIDTVPSEALDRLVRYHWPGNIRELQNLIERSVILTTGTALRIPLLELVEAEAAPPAADDVRAAGGTLVELEREAIRRALADTRGVIGGPKGAAVKLGMKRTSLLYRMEKLGIRKSGD